jgi:asparagine synthase (glutamine-hydrolysing)
MSGIIGILNLNGAPVTPGLLQRMMEPMDARWPDVRGTWSEGGVALGHAMLRATDESANERQPISFDGLVWITADARVDGRAELIRLIESDDGADLRSAPDVELILRAYRLWGEDCVSRLIGDFSFAIWDGRTQSLFCARDHFGVKPFYYVRTADSLIFASDIDALREHPDVSDRLNETAVGDFLVFSGNQDETSTVYDDIRRLPPAHRLIATRDRVRIERYWTLPADGHIRYADDREYVAHYRELFDQAVTDRLRTDRVSVMMSGGTDSAAIAAVAAQSLRQERSTAEVRAFTIVYNSLLPGDEEGYYAGLAAKSADVKIDYLAGDDYRLFERWNSPELYCQQPIDHSTLAVWFDCYFLCANHSRVVLTGYGGDPAMGGWNAYYMNLLKRGRVIKFMLETSRHILRYRTMRGMSLRSELRREMGVKDQWVVFPSWLDEEFTARTGLKERFELYYEPKAKLGHKTHPDAYEALATPLWSDLFESDFPVSAPIEARHPFFDLRLINFLLAIPPVPWCRMKMIHREAMRGVLPELVRTRPKAPLAGDRALARLNHPTTPDTLETSLPVVGDRYVDRKAFRRALDEYKRGVLMSYAPITAPLSLEYWMELQSSKESVQSTDFSRHVSTSERRRLKSVL